VELPPSPKRTGKESEGAPWAGVSPPTRVADLRAIEAEELAREEAQYKSWGSHEEKVVKQQSKSFREIERRQLDQHRRLQSTTSLQAIMSEQFVQELAYEDEDDVLLRVLAQSLTEL